MGSRLFGSSRLRNVESDRAKGTRSNERSQLLQLYSRTVAGVSTPFRPSSFTSAVHKSIRSSLRLYQWPAISAMSKRPSQSISSSTGNHLLLNQTDNSAATAGHSDESQQSLAGENKRPRPLAHPEPSTTPTTLVWSTAQADIVANQHRLRPPPGYIAERRKARSELELQHQIAVQRVAFMSSPRHHISKMNPDLYVKQSLD